MSSGLTFNALMKHMRAKNLSISGSDQKRQLMLSGYFHGYKGYRYLKNPSSTIPFQKYSDLQAIIDFDEEVKSSLYRPIMQLETTLKSISTEPILRHAKSDSLNSIMDQLMNANSHRNQAEFRKRKYKLRDEIHASLTYAYTAKKGNVIAHYYNSDRYVPIWAVFETITLGVFGTFVELLDPETKLEISEIMGLPLNFNTDGALLHEMIYVLQDLRNSIAHNNIVFDARYRGNRKISNALKQALIQETGIRNITFDSFVDDIILVAYLMKKLKYRKSMVQPWIRRIIGSIESIHNSLDTTLYSTVFPTDSRNKLLSVERYVK